MYRSTMSNYSKRFDVRDPIDHNFMSRVRSPLKRTSGSFSGSPPQHFVNNNQTNRPSFDQRSSWGYTPGGNPRN